MIALASSCKSQVGYTLIEMVVVASLFMVGSAVAIPVSTQMVKNAKGDSALMMTATFLQTARNRAVAERRNIVLTLVSENSLQIERIEVPDGSRTVLDTLTLEGAEEFVRAAGLSDTPDRFGGVNAINFTGDEPVMFTSDGSFIDAAGDVTNATIFIAEPGAPETARAVTISGVTGLLRVWKWRGAAWMQ